MRLAGGQAMTGTIVVHQLPPAHESNAGFWIGAALLIALFVAFLVVTIAIAKDSDNWGRK
ncbi:MAG TPA: hypothetical protein VLF21_01800 [Candidatus Saccharimonadales bacterium]|nr:hypothetical protein [Candidatus Saccharimonadales bacterium]